MKTILSGGLEYKQASILIPLRLEKLSSQFLRGLVEVISKMILIAPSSEQRNDLCDEQLRILEELDNRL